MVIPKVSDFRPDPPPHFGDLADIIAAGLRDSGVEVSPFDIVSDLQQSSRPEKGEVALKLFGLKGRTGLDVAELANRIAANAANYDLVWETSIDLPYINFSLRYSRYATRLAHYNEYFTNIRSNVKLSIVVEHTQPNTHKDLHIGHLRNTILGDTLVRNLRLFCENVTAVDYHGDEGVHVARSLWYIKRHFPNLVPPSDSPGTWLGEIYPAAVAEVEAAKGTILDAEYRAQISEILKNIEGRKGKDYELWKKTRDWSLQSFRKIYQWLDVRFDAEFAESDVSDASQKMVDEYLSKGVFERSEGAIGCDLNEFGLGFCLLRKSDGAGLYATKDVQLAITRHDIYDYDLCVYVVDNRQTRHFDQVFHTVAKMGFPFGERCHHLGYDIVQTRHGTISSRKGDALSADSVISELTDAATKRINERGNEPLEAGSQSTSKAVALAALRYGMLKVDPAKKIMFDLDEWVSFEGNTGPYLLYCFVRIRSILRRAEFDLNNLKNIDNQFALLSHEEERRLCDLLLRLPHILFDAAAKQKPNVLCNYVYNIAQVFSSYYNRIPILGCTDPEQREARLLLCHMLEGCLRLSFAVIGIHPLERL
jgi:arginyl-tRNA synthetase